MPWIFGGVQPPVQIYFFAIAAMALAFTLLAEWIQPSSHGILPTALVPLLLFLTLGALQLVPLGGPMLATVSPEATAMRASLAGEANPSDIELVRQLELPPPRTHQPVSLYPASTRHDLAMWVLGLVVFLCGALLFRSAAAVGWLAAAVALNGAALAFFGFVQALSWNGMLYWIVPLKEGGAPFASFVNRNHAGGYLNLCLACALGWLFWTVSRNAPASDRDIPSAGYRNSLYHRRKFVRLSNWSRHINAPTIAAVALSGTLVAGVFCSMSRGAMVAMVGAMMVTVLLLAFAHGKKLLSRILLLSLGSGAGIFLVLWIGFEGQVLQRASTLLDTQEAAAGRLSHWRQSLTSVPDFWATGTGLGTYRFVYVPYQTEPAGVWYYHAENNYVETLVEAGIPGFALLLAAIALVALATFRLIKHHAGSPWAAIGIAGALALASQAIQSFTDFGLYTPANMVLFALLCGAICGAAAQLHAARPLLALSPAFSNWCPAVALLGGLLVALTWAGWENHRAAAVATGIGVAFWSDDTPPPGPERIQHAIERLQRAVASRADDAEGHLHLARLWTQLWRTRAFEQQGGRLASPAQAADTWQSTSTVALHAAIHRIAWQGKVDQLQQLRHSETVQQSLPSALEQLVLARRACPLLPEAHIRLGEISSIAADPAADQVHLDRTKSLAPAHPDLLFRCGLLELQATRVEKACESWHACLLASDRHLGEIMAMAGRQVSLWHLVHRILPESPAKLIHLARTDRHVQAQPLLRDMLLERADQLTDDPLLPPDERFHAKGVICLMRDEYDEAISYLQRALEIRWDQDEWRYDLALALKRETRLDEAHEQARLCAQRSPDNPRYRTLLTEIHRERILGAAQL